jgi:Family of unknown function (DUF6263)
MKKIVLLSFSFVSLLATAQNLKLDNGKTFKITTTVNTTGELMGSEMKNNTTSISTLKITSTDVDKYKGVSTVTKMTVTGSMMGQDMNFDSDKKGDMDGQLGQMFGSAINKPTDISIDKTTGKQDEKKAEDEDADGGPMGGLMGGAKAGSSSIFYLLPKDKKVGDKWSETIDKDGIKVINNYEIQILTATTATILLNTTSKGSTTQDMNGQSVEVTVDSKSAGSFVVDITTGVIKQSQSETDMTTNMEVAGQSMAITNKMKVNTVVE